MKADQPIPTIALQRVPALQLRKALKNLLSVMGLLLLGAYWVNWTASHLSSQGLFFLIGVDWGMFWAAAHAFHISGPDSVYNLTQLGEFVRPLFSYYNPNMTLLKVNPVPYPPIFMLLLWPFSLFQPVIGFVLWTATNALAAGYVVVRLARRFNLPLRFVLPTVFATAPLMLGLLVGQPVGLLMLGFYELYINLERGEDMRAGLWGGLLLLKPQYAVILGLVLLFKHRWSAIGGFTIAGAAIAISTLIVLGPSGTLDFIHSVTGYASGFQQTSFRMAPQEMISWRGVLVALMPHLKETVGLIATMFLSALTVASLPFIWRGKWNPTSEHFATQMLATMIITMLVGFDVHIHGAVLLIIPAIAVFSRQRNRLLHLVLIVATFLEMPLAVILANLTGRMLMETTALVFAVLQMTALIIILIHRSQQVSRVVDERSEKLATS
jgi:hypothetical protein